MKQQSLEATGYEKYRKKTRKEQFLEEMEQIVPWQELCEVTNRVQLRGDKQAVF